MASVGTISGLASGIQWRDMIDQIMAAEEARRLTPIQTQVTAQQKRADAWNSFSSVVSRLRSTALRVQDGSAFGALRTTVTAGNGTRAGFTASAGASAAAGTYGVEVLETAKAEKLSGRVHDSATATLGASYAGALVVNGRRVEVTATDSLTSVRDKINAVNSGTNPSRVSATLLSTGNGTARLVLTSEATGAGGIQLADEAGAGAGPLKALGLTDGTTAANRTADGRTQSFRMSSSSAALTTLLGVSPPPASTSVLVGGKRIDVDFATDSLQTVVARVNAAGGFAELREEAGAGGTKSYRMVVAGDVAVDSSPNFGSTAADSRRALELLGLSVGGRAASAQSVSGAQLLDGNGDPATAATKLADLAGGVQAGDTFTFRGTRGDGSTVDLTYTVADPAAESLGDVVAKLNNATDGYGAGTRTATASVVDGRIVLTDGTKGDSRLSLAMTANNEGGGSLSFGASATTAGFAREVTRGTDARARIDGVLVTQSSNTLASAIPGVTLTLSDALPGTTSTVTIERDVEFTVSSIKALATEYNAALNAAQQLTGIGGALQSSGALRGAMSSLKNALLTDIAGLAPTNPYTRGAVAGLALTKTGTLEVDDVKLRAALTSNAADVKAAFSSAGRASDPQATFVLAGDRVQAGTYAVNVTALATQAAHTGSGLAGAYSGTDELKVTDSVTGKTATLASLDGRTAAQIAAELNAAFGTEKMDLVASDDGGQLRITHGGYGSAAKFTLTGTFDEAQLGFVKSSAYAGTDIQGTIGGKAATGRGRILTGDRAAASTPANPAEGLAVEWKGGMGAAGTVTYALGVGGMMLRAADGITRAGDGMAASQSDGIQSGITKLNKRLEDVQHALDLRRESMTKSFALMESALSRVQSQTSWLTSQINALPSWSDR
ncbi:flagellar filament capping protein FliD [Longimicrobium sp.]|uniref:flagellar filament capping protein FliD n=1 Tax=Longimicrobium sp. TaxID=2029185 RepID=UPI002E323AA7|nr:flagellar filament capping protein FliD [Longimicrobium sp.]HEX6037812.1 flagellar filament capping protein FliD [Longimicrobium sp.]